jgi:hypothetical protein
MRRRAQPLLLASLLALYGVITLGGPALHALPGPGHADSLGTHEGDGPTGRDAKSHDDCPICHFAAQGQLLASSNSDHCVDVAQFHPPADLPLVAPPTPARPSSPRAPPLA